MTSQVLVQLLLRLIPSVLLLVTGFLVVRDENVQERWIQLLVKSGSIRPNQAQDPKMRQNVKLPFFILGGLFLIWPLLYMARGSYAQRPVEVIPLPTPRPTPTPAVKKGAEPTPTPTLAPLGVTDLPQALPETEPPPPEAVSRLQPRHAPGSPSSGTAASGQALPTPIPAGGGASGRSSQPLPTPIPLRR